MVGGGARLAIIQPYNRTSEKSLIETIYCTLLLRPAKADKLVTKPHRGQWLIWRKSNDSDFNSYLAK